MCCGGSPGESNWDGTCVSVDTGHLYNNNHNPTSVRQVSLHMPHVRYTVIYKMEPTAKLSTEISRSENV